MAASRTFERWVLATYLLLASCAESDGGSDLGSTAAEGPAADDAVDEPTEPDSTPADSDTDEDDTSPPSDPVSPSSAAADAGAVEPPTVNPLPVTPVVPALPTAPVTAMPTAPAAPTIPPVTPAPTVPDAGTSEPTPEPAPVGPDWPFDAMNDPIENPLTCPESEPAQGDGCSDESLVCKYGSEIDCRSRWFCSSGQWYLNYGPRDCPESCPSAEPAEGDPCDVDRAVCDYGDDPACTAQWLCWEGTWARTFQGDCEVATTCPEVPPETGDPCGLEEVTPVGGLCIWEGATLCSCSCYWESGATSATMTWSCAIISADLPPDYLTACPRHPPDPGSACDTSSGCGYVSADECVEQGTGTTFANCVDGAWVLSDSEMF